MEEERIENEIFAFAALNHKDFYATFYLILSYLTCSWYRTH